ncbi:MAG: hypothetical protein IT373_04750 [Polyangiaceae bacterium]|nr:hypothetical protein [Polyangiaceae bacterium]
MPDPSPLATLARVTHAAQAASFDPATRHDAELGERLVAELEAAVGALGPADDAPLPLAALEGLRVELDAGLVGLSPELRREHDAWVWSRLQRPGDSRRLTGQRVVGLQVLEALRAAVDGLCTRMAHATYGRLLTSAPAPCDCHALVASGHHAQPSSTRLERVSPAAESAVTRYRCGFCGTRWAHAEDAHDVAAYHDWTPLADGE